MSTPKVCSTTRPTSEEIGLASSCVARVVRMSRLALVRILQRAQLEVGPVVRRMALNNSASTSAGGSGGSELSCGDNRSVVPAALTVTR